MTSKRLGILVFAFVAVWSLVGLNGIPMGSQAQDFLTVSSAYAGADGDPDEYTGNPEAQQEEAASESSRGGSSKRLKIEEVGDTLLEALSGFLGSLFGKG